MESLEKLHVLYPDFFQFLFLNVFCWSIVDLAIFLLASDVQQTVSYTYSHIHTLDYFPIEVITEYDLPVYLP